MLVCRKEELPPYNNYHHNNKSLFEIEFKPKNYGI